jgi:Lrp/AsnC family leucine-responsive transcriptional regulator
MLLDKIDRTILNTLQESGKITNSKLSGIVGISQPATLERVKRLEAAGIISHFTAVLDHEKIGYGIMAIITISLSLSQLQSVPVIKEEFRKLDEVIECYQLSGENDFFMKVLSKDIKSYAEFINSKLTKIKGIQEIKSSFVLDNVKVKKTITLNSEMDTK